LSAKKQKVDLASSCSDTLVGSTVTIYPIYMDYEDEWWQHTPLSKHKLSWYEMKIWSVVGVLRPERNYVRLDDEN